MAELKRMCQKQIMEEVLHAINGTPEERSAAAQGSSAYKVLVLDGFATKIISSCCRMSDITDAGVSHVENLAVRRQPLPMLEAIYFAAPTKASVDAICRDYSGRKRPQYAKAHIVFTGHLSDVLLQQISQNRNLCGRIAALKELNMEFLAVEDAVFSLEMKNVFHDLYASPAAPGKAATTAKMAQRLASLCITLGGERGELPLIRFDQASAVASDVASALGARVALLYISFEPLSLRMHPWLTFCVCLPRPRAQPLPGCRPRPLRPRAASERAAALHWRSGHGAGARSRPGHGDSAPARAHLPSNVPGSPGGLRAGCG